VATSSQYRIFDTVIKYIYFKSLQYLCVNFYVCRRDMENYFGRTDAFFTEPHSPPAVCFRNKEAHGKSLLYSKQLKPKEVYKTAWNSTLYYKRHVQDCPVNSKLLYEHLVDDARLSLHRTSNLQSGCNSLIGEHGVSLYISCNKCNRSAPRRPKPYYTCCW
jgi:hypothetical protein